MVYAERPAAWSRPQRSYAERRFHAMGSEAHVIAVGWQARELSHLAEWRVLRLEDRWSRVREESELSRLNANAGSWFEVSDDTIRLVDRSLAAWRMTGGAFDPTALNAVRAAGYDRSFEDLPAVVTIEARDSGFVTNLAAGRIEVDAKHRAVRLPPGVGIDPGGIGKGLAADLVVADLMAAGADGVLVNLGGDIRVAGTPPPELAADGQWSISIDDPFEPQRELARIAIGAGAIATSSRLKRHWSVRFTQADDGIEDEDPLMEAHHLFDPRTGRSTRNDIASVTVCAGEGWWAEAQTKQALVAGRAGIEETLTRAPSIVVDADRVAHASDELKAALRWKS